MLSYGGDPLLSGGWGLADKAQGTVPTETTLFRSAWPLAQNIKSALRLTTGVSRIASVSKVFPALLTYILATQGRLNLDDPVSHHTDRHQLDTSCGARDDLLK
jgi:CubicO group peptidase (beta-lactamase class C family)